MYPVSTTFPRAMTATDLKELESAVLDWIREENAVSTEELLAKHAEAARVTGEELRRAVWNLVDRGKVSYDLSWRLTATK